MDSTALPLQSGSFWISIVLIGLFVAAVSAFFQLQANKSDELNKKSLLRDGLLGSIVGAMGWIMVPESMEKVSSTFVQSIDTKNTIENIANTYTSFTEPTELHLGNPDF
jgi:hypothetical protein